MHLPFASLPLRPIAACMLAIGASALAPGARAAESFVVTDIRIEGLQRTDPGTVFASLPFRVGDTYSDDKGAAALRALFATGLFKDVRIEIDGRVLVLVVEERAVIATVTFVGLKEFDSDTLSKALKDSGIGEGLPFDRALIDRAEQEVKRQYLTRSLYGAEVVTTITPLERNRVNVTFTMTEGDAAKIREIRIVGSKVFSESTLLGLFEQSTGGWLTWYTKTDRYSRSKLNADLETIRAYYTNRGYLEFEIESTQVTISPDKQDISITITVREGQRYTVTAVKLEGEYLGKEEEFKRLVRIRPGEPYRSEDVAQTTKLFGDLFGLYGYAFARTQARPEIDRANGQVAVVLMADPQRRVYVRRINVAGNNRTRDEVVRREFRQFESAWYDGGKIKLSRDRVDRLGYFKEVEIETEEVPGTTDQVDLTIKITEKATGSMMIGAGYSSMDKVTLNASIKQENVFGTGNYLGIEFNTGKSNRLLVLSTVDPYFTIDGISRAIDVFYRTTKPINSQGEEYELRTPGATLRFGIPFSDFDTVFVGLGVESTEIVGNVTNKSYRDYRELYGSTSTAVPLTLGWSRDDRDSALAPNSGSYRRVNLEWSIAGDVRYLRTNLQYQHYIPITNRFTLGLNSELGWGEGLGEKPYPIFKNFFGGGLGSVRAFEQGSLGVVDVTNNYIGGNRKFNVNAELYVPVPGAGNDKSIRLFGFMDAGNVWGESEKIEASSLRASTGIGLSWLSPVGPLKLSWGVPLRYEPNDRIQQFQFQIGTAF
jgi:outer membrane protein insertion porin family